MTTLYNGVFDRYTVILYFYTYRDTEIEDGYFNKRN